MNVKDKFNKVTESVDRGLWKLVGKENDILFHFLRIILACISVAVLGGIAVGIIAVLWRAVLMLSPVIVGAAPYLVAIAVVLGIVAIQVLRNRLKESKRRREIERQNALSKQAQEQQRALAQQAEERGRARSVRIHQSVLAADQKTRNNIETILASLRRFALRLEVAIAPAHYNDLFGDNWVSVREFSESSQGRKVPEVSALLVDIIICYKQAQDIPWIPENSGRIQIRWNEASKKRKWLSQILEAAQATSPIASDVLEAEVLEEPQLLPIPEMAVTPPPTPPSQKTASIREMAVQPPPAPPKMLPPREVAVVGPAPKLSIPPTLEELQRYCTWVSGNN